MKKLAVLAMALIGLLPVLSHATPAFEPPAFLGSNLAPDKNTSPGFLAPNLEFIGISTPMFVEASTGAGVAILLASGQGLVYEIDDDSGTAGDYCIFFDSASTVGITVNTKGKSLTPAVLTSANGSTSCTGSSFCGSYEPRRPHQFANGIVGIKFGTGANNCKVYARTYTGSNP